MDAVASLFNRIVECLPNDNFEGFKARIVNLNLHKRFGEIVELWRGKSRENRDDAELVKRHWTALAQVLGQIIPAMNPRPVLMIDEITHLCENLHKKDEGSSGEVTRLLSMLREWREAGMTMAMAGSVGIRQYLRSIGVSLNLLTGIISIPLPAMSKEDAQKMLEALACHQGIGWWNDHVSRAIIENSADLTHAAMQFTFDHVVAAYDETKDFSRAAIDALFRDVIRPQFDHEFYQQFDQRLKDYGELEQRIIRQIFQTIARSGKTPKVRTFKDLEQAVPAEFDGLPVELEELIQALVEDGFLIDDPDRDRIGFVGQMVENWWQVRDHRRGRRRPPRPKGAS